VAAYPRCAKKQHNKREQVSNIGVETKQSNLEPTLDVLRAALGTAVIARARYMMDGVNGWMMVRWMRWMDVLANHEMVKG
jgi:hypothetical protein